ncbi:hypothetical protein [Amycolatopsis sp. DG1A-15b]|uniref:hypothetical protein n=1 Tax=Amycolatopsis sp. DG1A-15b TaxID=3052846 RepID=UPI00255B538A|nr:hypothetical protein [Amycolatopsis sp. DG1A-15b]WIX90335.1 hypothetical protein QRY02_07840 [Amycolatopsis sp. DG1A-15b]
MTRVFFRRLDELFPDGHQRGLPGELTRGAVEQLPNSWLPPDPGSAGADRPGNGEEAGL